MNKTYISNILGNLWKAAQLCPLLSENKVILHQVQELHRKLSEESRRADNLAFEMKKFEEKHETVLKEKEVQGEF